MQQNNRCQTTSIHHFPTFSNLDTWSKEALCKATNLDYYTKPHDCTRVHIMGGNMAHPPKVSRTTARTDSCKVTTTWFGYFSIRKATQEVLESVELKLPEYTYESQAVWVPVPHWIREAVEAKELPCWTACCNTCCSTRCAFVSSLYFSSYLNILVSHLDFLKNLNPIGSTNCIT
ncbi:hypothetical protein PS2_021362 [Malus domestica]